MVLERLKNGIRSTGCSSTHEVEIIMQELSLNNTSRCKFQSPDILFKSVVYQI